LTYKRMRDRDVIRGEAFKFAPSGGKNPNRVSKEEFKTDLQSHCKVEAVRALARFLSIGGIYAEEALMRAGVEKTKICDLLNDHEVDLIYESLQDLLSQIMNEPLQPCVILDATDSLVDAVPLRLKRYESDLFKIQRCGTFNEALDQFYSKFSALEAVAESTKIDKLEAEAARLERIITDQKNVVTRSHDQAEQDKHVGDLIYGHFSELQTVLDKFLVEEKSEEELKQAVLYALDQKHKGVKPWTLFEAFDRKEFTVTFCVDGIQFSVNLQKTLFESASEFYELGKRAKQKMEGAQTALNDSLKRLNEVQTKIRQAQQLGVVRPAEAIEILEKRKIQHREWFEKFRWFVSSDGFLVVAGRDAVTNEVLIKKHTDSNDVVFHADIIGAPFVVIKTEGKKPSEQCLREAAEFAAAFSRAWREGFASVDVYWVKPEQLGKGGPSGESVAHGAFVVRGERTWMRRVPLSIAVGVSLDEKSGARSVKGGPVDSVKTKANAYVVIVPGGLDGKDLFRRVLRNLSEKVSKDLRQAILSTSVEAIRDFIPFSKGAILEN
jgi:predicted ribosome quality control (RQC) complex YloA/Tae2 family protein